MNPAATTPIPLLGMALALAAMLLFACCSIVTSIAARRLDTDAGALIAALVNLPLGLVLVAAQVLVFGPLRPVSAIAIAWFLLAGVFSTYLGRWLFFKSIEAAGPTRATSFQAASPIVTALLGWVFLGQTLGALALAGIVIGVAGLAITSLGPLLGKAAAQTPRPTFDTRSLLLIGLGSASAYSVSQILRAAGVQAWSEPVVGVTLGAVAGSLALTWVQRKELRPLRRRILAQPAASMLYAGVGCMQIVAQTLLIASLLHIPASIAALVSMSSPLVVLPLSLLLFRNRERIGFAVVFGILITLAGVGLTVLQAA